VLSSIAGSVSDGRPWYGREVEQGSVAYLLFEGDAFWKRALALREVGGLALAHLHYVRMGEPLSPTRTRDGEAPSRGEQEALGHLDAIATEVATRQEPPVRLLIIDTVRASMDGSEDSSEHTSAYLRSVRRLMARVPAAGVILSHHSGWQDGENKRKRERGSSAWRGNVDTTLYLEGGDWVDDTKTARRLTLQTFKVRDGEEPPPLRLVRKRVELSARDRHGRLVTSCVIDRDWHPPTPASAAARDDAFDHRVLRLIGDRPELATAQTKLRQTLNVRTADLSAAMSRLLLRQWVTLPDRKGQPYTVTLLGQAVLNGQTP
jgi:hypothetical protein